MRAYLPMLAFLLSANAAAPLRAGQATETPQSAGPWVDCMRKVGKEHFRRGASLGEYEGALDDRCGAEGAEIRSTHPNVYRLSLQEALDTYEYCVTPGNGGSPRCRNLR